MKYLLILLSITLAACGGSTDPQDQTNQPDQEALYRPAQGLWTGQILDDGIAYAVTALLYDGRIMAISEAAGITYNGRYAVHDGEITGTFTGYQISGGPVNSGTLAGTVEPGKTITATFTAEGRTGQLALALDERYNQDSAIALVSGNWHYVEGGYSVTLAIDDDGEFNGQDDGGCGYRGRVEMIDADYNLYRITLFVEACGLLDGTYTGFGGLYDDGQRLQTVVSNAQALFIYSFDRQ